MRINRVSKAVAAVSALTLVAGMALPAAADGYRRGHHKGYSAGHHGAYGHGYYGHGRYKGGHYRHRGKGIGTAEAFGIAAGVIVGAALLDSALNESRRPASPRYGYSGGYRYSSPPTGAYYSDDPGYGPSYGGGGGYSDSGYSSDSDYVGGDEPEWANDLAGGPGQAPVGRAGGYEQAYGACLARLRAVVARQGGSAGTSAFVDYADQDRAGVWTIGMRAPTRRAGTPYLARVECVADGVRVRELQIT